MTRIRVSGTVDSAVAVQVDLEHEARVLTAKSQEKKPPCYSETVEDLLKKGLISSRHRYFNEAPPPTLPQPTVKLVDP